MEIIYYNDYKRLNKCNYDNVVKLTLNTDNDKPSHGKIYSLLNLKELSLSNINKKFIDRRLLNLINLTSLIIKNLR